MPSTPKMRLFACALIAALSLPAAGRVSGEDRGLRRQQATIKGLVIRQLDNGKHTGAAIGIVATAQGEARNGKITISGKIGDDMKSALDEAERYVRTQYPKLRGADIQVSFEDRYTPKDGGSAGTAFAVLLRSLTDGFDIDPAVSITGDIAVNGTVQQIGGVAAKLRGSSTDGSTIAIIPKQNTPAVADLLIGMDKVDALQQLQVFSVDTVDAAIAVAREDREKRLAQAIDLYREVQAALQTKKIVALRDPKIQATLRQVVELAPNHVSAKYALDVAQNKAPRTLTRVGSLVEVFAAAAPFTEAMSGGGLTRDKLPKSTVRQVQKDLLAVKRITHPEVENVRKSVVDWIDVVDRLLSATGPLTPNDVKVIERRQQALQTALKRLNTDEQLVAKMMREGY
jgi:hypothetical protein